MTSNVLLYFSGILRRWQLQLALQNVNKAIILNFSGVMKRTIRGRKRPPNAKFFLEILFKGLEIYKLTFYNFGNFRLFSDKMQIFWFYDVWDPCCIHEIFEPCHWVIVEAWCYFFLYPPIPNIGVDEYSGGLGSFFSDHLGGGKQCIFERGEVVLL